jgi:ATP/maltotriose-dependent transcriptional regulator MalT
MVALGERAQGLEWAARALALSPAPSSVVLYNVAAVYALAGDEERSLDFLERAVQAGYRQREAIENDPDFQVLRGRPRYRALLQNRFLNREAPPGSEASLFQELTRREREVLDLVARGLSNDEIAGRLHIGAKTVRNHLTHLFSKLGVTRRAAAIVQAREAGFGRETA